MAAVVVSSDAVEQPVSDAPSLEELFVFSKWKACLEHLAAPKTTASAWWDRIRAAYSAPGRHYHTVNHLADMLAGLDDFVEVVERPVVIYLAIFFHDYVYDPKSPTNEEDSATQYRKFAVEVKQPQDEVDAVARYIMATKDHQIGNQEENEELKAFVDLDVAVLGRRPDRYMVYASQIRQEYTHVQRKTYCEKRAEFLTSFLTAPRPIFASEQYQRLYEGSARNNVSAELALLSRQIIPGEEVSVETSHQEPAVNVLKDAPAVPSL
jgi:predicted metal-dependent HD superfamily phosphohydrolase